MKKLVLGLGRRAVRDGRLASAQDRRPGYGPVVNLAAAKKIAAGTIAECAKNSWNVAVAVVDTHGSLLYFERMEDTQYASNDIAIGKAKAAATYRRPTRAFADVINKGGAGDGHPARRHWLSRRRADHGRRQGHRRGRRQRRHRRPGRAMRHRRREGHVALPQLDRKKGPRGPFFIAGSSRYFILQSCT